MNTPLKDKRTIKYLENILSIKDANITISRNTSGDRIVKVNESSAINLDSKGSYEYRVMLESAYKRSTKN